MTYTKLENTNRYYQPNGSYYGESKKYSFWELGSNPRLTDFGIKNRIPCGGHWILGDGFAFKIQFSADSYNHMAFVYEYNKSVTEKWHELELHLLEYMHTWLTDKHRNTVAMELGVIEDDIL